MQQSKSPTSEQLNRLIRALSVAARYVTDAASMVAWARVVELTCCGRKQAQNDAFATPAMIAAFVQLAPRATTPDSVECLTNAIASITIGTTQATSDAFATPATVNVFVQLAPHATTPDSIQYLSDRQHHLRNGR